MPRAFVSHSTRDDSYVAEMESFLRAASFDDVFNDVSAIQPDERFWPEIEMGITSCDTLFVIITAASNASDWVRREVEFARGISKKIIPVWIEDCPLPPIFADRDVIDFRPRVRKERRFDISRILKYAPAELIGREDETKLLNDAWQQTLRLEKFRPHVLTFVGLGGEGKTSLVSKWLAEMAGKNWPGCDAAFAWTFYSQGRREQLADSSYQFLREALIFFGEKPECVDNNTSPHDKGQLLADLVGKTRSLLILDGLEPLQYPPGATPFEEGQIKDAGIAKLLKDLATSSNSLCIVTTRYKLPDLKAFLHKTAQEKILERLSKEAGVALLQSVELVAETPVKISGTLAEFEALVEDLKGHALCLTLIGSYLVRFHFGDISKRDLVKLDDADSNHHAFHIMDAYVRSFAPSGIIAWFKRLFKPKEHEALLHGKRAVAVLRLMGLFDRPASASCLLALRRKPISGLTKPLSKLADKDWVGCLTDLEAARLLTINLDYSSNTLLSLDAHPLIREYFAQQLRQKNPKAWRAGHQQLYEHLCSETHDKPVPTIEDLQPLFEAVIHGCEAGLHDQAFNEVYLKRIVLNKRDQHNRPFGASSGILSVLKMFFDQNWTNHLEKWSNPYNSLSDATRRQVLEESGTYLFILGRLQEGASVLDKCVDEYINTGEWSRGARCARLARESYLLMGELSKAKERATLGIVLSKKMTDNEGKIEKLIAYAAYAHVIHQMKPGNLVRSCFNKAIKIQGELKDPPLYGSSGIWYCDWLLDNKDFDKIDQIAAHMVDMAKQKGWLMESALIHLSVGQCLAGKNCGNVEEIMSKAVNGIRFTGQQHHLVKTLITRAEFRVKNKTYNGPNSAQSDLDEAWEIAERGPMKLFMADIQLRRAQLFRSESTYPWESPQADLAAARKLIEECGYGRRKVELENLEEEILGKSTAQKVSVYKSG